jgi:CubicO group peptidase (beta-lactamase class C family)
VIAWGLGLLTLAVLSLGPQRTPRADASVDSIDSIGQFIDQAMPTSGVPGLAYAVVEGGEVTRVGARGVVELGESTAVTVETPFVSGSISKSFTAVAIMQLVEGGRVELDAELSRYLEDFAGRASGSITIRQLLSHTSGFSTLQGNTARGDVDDLARSVQQSASVVPAHPPGPSGSTRT